MRKRREDEEKEERKRWDQIPARDRLVSYIFKYLLMRERRRISFSLFS